MKRGTAIRRSWITCIAIAFVLMASLWSQAAGTAQAATQPAPHGQLAGKRVVLDPGHGWRNDRGASANGLREADIVLDVADRAKAILEAQGIAVGLTRTGYEPNVGLEAADDRANAFRPDVVVSIHANAGRGTGTESCYVVDKPTSENSQRLAAMLTTHVSERLGLRIRGNFPENRPGRRCGDGHYLYIHWMSAPAALIELAFVDGPLDNDVAKLRDRRQDFAQAIADAIVEYLGGHNGGGAPAGYTFCAWEGERCSFSGTADVAYGANGRFAYRSGVSGGIDCNNGVFGDPVYGVRKACYFRQTSSGPTQCPGRYRAEYFANRSLSGNPVLVRCEDWPIRHDWSGGSPGSGVPDDGFSVRWTGRARIESGTYTFIARADDGIRVYLNGTPIIDAWRDQPPTQYRVTRQISGGEYEVRVEYYENGGGAVAEFRWERASGSSQCSGIPLVLERRVEGRLDDHTPAIIYCLQGFAGQTISLRMLGLAENRELDPILRILLPNGQLLAENDDDPYLGYDSFLRVQLPENGVYSIIATRYGQSKGAFALRVEAGLKAAAGDVDRDCDVDRADRDLVRANLGNRGERDADVDLNGIVNITDLLRVDISMEARCP